MDNKKMEIVYEEYVLYYPQLYREQCFFHLYEGKNEVDVEIRWGAIKRHFNKLYEIGMVDKIEERERENGEIVLDITTKRIDNKEFHRIFTKNIN